MTTLAEQNYYEILELPRDASRELIDEAYDRVAAVYGPDSLVGYALLDPAESQAMLRRIEEAYETLSDPGRRRDYDARESLGEWGFAARSAPALFVDPVHLHEEQESDLKFMISGLAERMPEAWVGTPMVSPPPPPPEPSPVMVPPPSIVPPPPVPPLAQMMPVMPVAPTTPALAPEPVPLPVSVPVPLRSAPARSEQPIPTLGPDESVTGHYLRAVRDARGISLQWLADMTRIGMTHLSNIEADRYAALPAKVYLRGFLQVLARELRLDPERVARTYLEQMTRGLSQK